MKKALLTVISIGMISLASISGATAATTFLDNSGGGYIDYGNTIRIVAQPTSLKSTSYFKNLIYVT